MEKKKTKLWKKILSIILIILLILLSIILFRYHIITTVQQKNEENDKRTNCYYYSETEDTIMEYWRKDGIMKLNVKQVKGTGDITFWEDTKAGEELVFWNAPEKIYSKGNGGMIKKLPTGMMFTEENSIRFLMAANPMLHIGSKKYNDKECYSFKIDEQEELIEKETGLILYSNNVNYRKLSYSFENVTDKDIEKLDITEYRLIENDGDFLFHEEGK